MIRIKLSIKKTLIFFHNFVLNFLFFFSLRSLYLRFLKNNIGDKVSIHNSIYMFDFSNISIGDNSTINNGCYLDNRCNISIGKNVNVSHDCKIYTVGHDVNDELSKLVYSPVIISDNAWIFPNCIVMPGVTISKGSVLYPGSVLTKSIPEYEVWGGNPAKFIKKRERKISYVLDNRVYFLK